MYKSKNRSTALLRRAASTVMVMLSLGACGLQEHPRGKPSATPGSGGESPPGTGGQATGGGPGTGGGGNGGGGGSGVDAAPAVPTGPGVMLGGQFVPREKAIVILHFGHSNMTGVSRTPAELRPYHYEPQPRLWMHVEGDTFVPAKEQTAPSPGHNGAGPGFAILRSLVAVAPPDLHFISIGKGRGSATTADYLKANDLYYADGFMERAIPLKGRVTFGSLWIMLGITDRHMPVPEQAGFADRLASIVADIRADLGEPNLPVLHTDYEVESTGRLSLNSEYAIRIRPLILSLPEKVTRLQIIPTDGLGMHDDHHFDFAGQKVWAERGVKLLMDKGWFPWGAVTR